MKLPQPQIPRRGLHSLFISEIAKAMKLPRKDVTKIFDL